ncbi:polysaccharide deacetylase family protein [Methylovulum psychrotolerans]|uniref:Polysaccharide deacetylase n=1 Tax=Methylovulum psychrotolerans TaxID=1704499 RepID=A0A2S5CN35_9GAMM|nr:polysaccharide deacetylase family protein [Methylovulum psychrotolerans]POZ52235.1 polysaccharide deacetylase [Methylovulum psychrotolerans]
MMQALALSLLTHCATWASTRGGQNKLFILIYHQVLDAPDVMRPGEADIASFSWQMQLLARHFNVLPLAEAVARLQDRSLPPRAVTITFDDGYADNLRNAVPILKQQNLSATFFIASGYLEGGRMWNDTVIEAIRNLPQPEVDLSAFGLGVMPLVSPAQRAATARTLLKCLKHLPPEQRLAHSQALAAQATALPDDLMLTRAQLRELHAQGMEIGGHTVNHPILATLDKATATAEIAENKAYLEQLLAAPIRFFAYPNGRLGDDYLLAHRDIAKACPYQAAFSTHPGVATAASDVWQLPRFTPWDATPLRFMLRMVWLYLKGG